MPGAEGNRERRHQRSVPVRRRLGILDRGSCQSYASALESVVARGAPVVDPRRHADRGPALHLHRPSDGAYYQHDFCGSFSGAPESSACVRMSRARSTRVSRSTTP